MWEFNEIKNWKQEEVPRNCRGKSDKSAMWVRTKINRKACEFVYVKLMELFIEFGINIITSHLQQVTIWIWKPLTKPEKKSSDRICNLMIGLITWMDASLSLLRTLCFLWTSMKSYVMLGSGKNCSRCFFVKRCRKKFRIMQWKFLFCVVAPDLYWTITREP